MQQIVHLFLNQNYQYPSPVLLALSGGPDSLALFHILKSYPQINLHVAHVDHNWRKESKKEAQILKQLIEKSHIPFHLKTLKEKTTEDQARKKRLAFFQELNDKHHFQAVIFGHHANDQAETVLKRFFEGASIFSLKAMSFISHYENLTIWRPLLPFSKKEIEKFLNKKNIKPFYDPTNDDTKYLRGKMRQVLIPHLNDIFQKEIAKPLQEISQEASLLYDYFSEKTSPLLKNDKMIDFSPIEKWHPLEVQFAIRYLLKKNKATFSRDGIKKACSLLYQKVGGKIIKQGNVSLKISKNKLFIDHC